MGLEVGMTTRTPIAGISIALFVGVLLVALSLTLPGCGPETSKPPERSSPDPQASVPAASPPKPAPSDVIAPQGLPEIGKWMYDPSFSAAQWLGETVKGRHLREPINVVVVDGFATSVQDAKQRLVANSQKAGYEVRRGHTSGYRGYIAGQFYNQLPEEKDHAFSDAPYELDNNHGRIFGPALIDGKYYFVGALSREKVVPLDKIKHQYVSFNRARDDFAEKLDANTNCHIAGFVDLSNSILDDANVTTGDHDGMAILISATE